MKKRPVLVIIQTVLCIACALALIVADLMIYFQGLAARSDDPMADIYSVPAIASKAIPVLAVLAAAIVVTALCAILKVKDPHAERAAVSVNIRNNTDQKMPASAVNIIRAVLLVIAVVFMIIGIFNGSLEDVFIKATNICTECIGLG